MKAVLISINKPHTDNINSGRKKAELRVKPPKLPLPLKVYTYETLKNGGCGKVINEWICESMTQWRMFMGIPAHMVKEACVTEKEIWDYCNRGLKDITEMRISGLKVYDKPKELIEFGLSRPPQSWCYVEEDKTI